jgi:hypothetical protein
MAERIKQVALTYVSHRFFWWATLFAVTILMAPNFVSVWAQRQRPGAAQAGGILLGLPLIFYYPSSAATQKRNSQTGVPN